MTPPPFPEFPKIPRLSREVLITEKIDGTQGVIHITADGDIFAGSRTRWIPAGDDHFGFQDFVYGNADQLIPGLGPGTHYGEWWGQGIQRHYGLKERRFSLFNVDRWSTPGDSPFLPVKSCPECCHVVPLLWRGIFTSTMVEQCLETLRSVGSVAAPGFMRPEGVIVYHVTGRAGFKKTLEGDDEWKGKSYPKTLPTSPTSTATAS